MSSTSSRAPFEVTWWDRFLIGIAPQWGMRRLHARAAAATLGEVGRGRARHYEAAGAGRRTDGWYRVGLDPNAANAPSLGALRDLSRDLRRNNGWARRAIRVISTNTVGWGIVPKAMTGPRRMKRRAEDATWYWAEWADSTGCDYDGRLTFSGLQRLVMETVVESGEALIVKIPARTSDGLAIPLRLRVLEPDYLDALRDGVVGESGGPILQGVEFDRAGRRAAYWLYPHHPGAKGVSALMSLRLESVRVPAEDVIHVYQGERPGQIRGVPWLASAIAKLHDFDDYDDALLMQQKIAACFAAFVRDVDGAASPLGEPDDEDDRIESLEPGHIEYLPPGKDVSFATPPATTDHATFTSTNLRRIAASLGVTFEDLTGDYSQVNFSSARMARIAHWREVHDWRWNMLIPQFCDGVWRWAMELAGALDGWKEIPWAEWTAPPMPLLEPEKEGLAYQRLIRSGVMTLPQAIRERGEDPDTHLEEYAASNERLDKLKIVLDSDPRKTNSSGQGQGAGSAPTEKDKKTEPAEDEPEEGAA